MCAAPLPLRVVTLLACSILLSAGCSTKKEAGLSEEAIRFNILGAAQLGQTKWAEAETAFRRALELRPDDPLLLTNTAIAVYQQQRGDEARALLERAAAVDPGYLSAHFNLGLIESRNGNFEQAAAHFGMVVESDPRELFARYYLGTSLARIGREDEAIEFLRAALTRDASHVSALYALGRLLLQRGEEEEGLQLITRSQEIRNRSGLDEAVGGEYAEQGPYSRAADYPGDALEAPAGIPVRFEPIVSVKLERDALGVVWAALGPVNEEGPRLVIGQRAVVLQLFPPGKSTPLATSPIEGSTIASLTAGDANGDGRLDLAALLLVRAAGAAPTLVPTLFVQGEHGTFSSPAPDEIFSGALVTPLESGLAGADLTLVDRDHDGDLDLFWCWSSASETGAAGSGCKLATNDGTGRFEARRTEDHGFGFAAAGPGPVVVAFADVDNDRDIDLLAAEPGGVHLFTNLRDGNFDDVSESSGLGPLAGGAGSLAVADLNKDGWMDLLVGGASLRLLLNRHGRFEPPIALADGPSDGGIVFDFDNDGFLDVAGSSTRGPLVLRNHGAGNWEEQPELLRAEGLGSDAAPLVALDLDGDGDLDAVVADTAGSIALLSNEGGNANGWIVLEPRGVGDNGFGIGAKIEVLSGALRQKFEVTRPLPVHAGLGSRKSVQAARLLWPGGVLQDEVDLQARATIRVDQLDRKGTSCPLLYAWRDGAWHFVTDFLGGSAIGYQHAPGVFSLPDTDEYVRIEGGLTEDESGQLLLRVNNQLEEVIWLDTLELVVVEHPRGTEVYPNERLMPGPPYPDFALFASDDLRPVVSAWGLESGQDLTDRLRAADRSFVDDFEPLAPKGYAVPHTLELDLGPFPAGRRVALLLDGWIDYADSTANVAASQAGLSLVPPRLLVADGDGGWVDRTPGVMGFPAGLPKTMLVDLTGRFPSTDHRLRIETNMRIYWDRARVMLGGENTPLRVTRVRPHRAELGFGGFPEMTSPDGLPPFGYDPGNVVPTHSWKAHVGRYTGYGDVTRLLDTIDDRFVTMRNGDQIELRFPSPGPAGPDTTRTYLLYADGFGKDMDPNSAASETVGPVPFHGMPVYPYPADVIPPVAQSADGLTPRSVLPSPDGWPGAAPLGARGSPPDVDLVLRGGTLVDGTGAPPRRADVALKNGRIHTVGDVGGLRATREIDATGLVVAPGFVDMHSHADLILLSDRDTQERLLAAKIRQGVTTVIVGNCGLGVAPATPDAAALLSGINAWMTPEGTTAGATSVGTYLDRLQTRGIVLNAGTLVPHGPARISSMGLAPGAPTADQLETIRRAVEAGLDSGAFGLSAGLIYPPGMYSATDELTVLARSVASRDRLFTCHVRGSSETLLRATEELIRIGRESGARVHHSHLEAVGERFWPQVARVLELEDQARATGVRLSHDIFPYTRAATMMSAIFPPWSLEGGVSALLERLADPEMRDRLRRELEGRIPDWPPWRAGGWPHNLVRAVGWDGILVSSVRAGGPHDFTGRSLKEIAEEQGCDPLDCVADLMLSQQGQVGQLVDEISGRGDRIDTLLSILAHPAAAVVSDAEDYGRGVPHPAHAGAFVRALRLSRERSLLSVQEVVRRMTSYPAGLLGIEDRGTIREGAHADLVLFDAELVGDRATWSEPRRTAEGVPWVLVNGRIVVEDGRYVGGLAGTVLRALP